MAGTFRLATDDERRYYEQRLYPLQDRVLAVAATYTAPLVLTGGTALARCHFGHRFSDDLDFLTSRPMAGNQGKDLAAALTAAGLAAEIGMAQDDFCRLFVVDGDVRLQVDVAPDSPRVQEPVASPLGVFVHGLRDLGANKVGAFENRTEVKDAVDLYYLARSLSWETMFADAALKRIPIAYEDLQHFLDTPMSGVTLLAKPLDPIELDSFVATARREIAAEIKKRAMNR